MEKVKKLYPPYHCIVELKDNEVLAVTFGEEIQGVLMRPTKEKIVELSSFKDYERIEEVEEEYCYQNSDIIIGVNDIDNNRIMKTNFTISFDTQIKGEDMIYHAEEEITLQIVKILI